MDTFQYQLFKIDPQIVKCFLVWIIEEICCVSRLAQAQAAWGFSRAHEDKLLDGNICQIPVVEDGGLAILYWRNPWCSLLVEKFLLLRSFVWNTFPVEMDMNGNMKGIWVQLSDNQIIVTSLCFYIVISLYWHIGMQCEMTWECSWVLPWPSLSEWGGAKGSWWLSTFYQKVKLPTSIFSLSMYSIS